MQQMIGAVALTLASPVIMPTLAAPKVAIAVTLKGVPGQGAAFAAPVARSVIERLLHG